MNIPPINNHSLAADLSTDLRTAKVKQAALQFGTPKPSVDPSQTAQATTGSDDLKEAFTDFVGQTLFSQMIKSMRSTQQPSAYFNGGRAEEIFQGQLDQVLAEEISDASAEKIADPMYELFMLKRQA
ncbi:MAG: rod-binding protein [Pirellulaceae bacterium]